MPKMDCVGGWCINLSGDEGVWMKGDAYPDTICGSPNLEKKTVRKKEKGTDTLPKIKGD